MGMSNAKGTRSNNYFAALDTARAEVDVLNTHENTADINVEFVRFNGGDINCFIYVSCSSSASDLVGIFFDYVV